MLANICRTAAALAVIFTCGLSANAKADGGLVIIGGGLGADNELVWRQIITESGPDPLILVIPAASAEPEESAAWAGEQLRRRGARVEIAPLAEAGEAFGGRAAGAAHNPELAAQARAADGFYFTGGAQARIVDLLAPGGVATPLLEAIRAAHAAGATIAGTSAGAAIMSRIMFRAPRPQEEILASGPQGEDLGPGLGFLKQPILVDQHFLARGRHLRLLSALCAEPDLRAGLGVDEDTALVVRDGEARIVGASAVALLHLEERRSCAPLAVRARFSLLRPGDVLQLDSMAVELPAAAAAAPLSTPFPAEDLSAAAARLAGGRSDPAKPALPQQATPSVRADADARTRVWGADADARVLDAVIWVEAAAGARPAAE